jgi:uncharacterized protein DUF5995
VIRRLTAVVERAEAEGSRLGYFPALYRRVTAAVLAALPTFDDAERMTRLDVVFAGRYLDAFAAHQAGGGPRSRGRSPSTRRPIGSRSSSSTCSSG